MSTAVPIFSTRTLFLGVKLSHKLLGPVSRTSRELFGPEKLVVKLQSACFEKLIFLHAFNIRKIKRIAKFEGLEPRRCEDIKGIVVPDIDPKSFGTFEKQAPGLQLEKKISALSAPVFPESPFSDGFCVKTFCTPPNLLFSFRFPH